MEIAGLDFSLSNLNSESKILDLGCGRGRTLIPLWENGLFAVGIDTQIGYLVELMNDNRLPTKIRSAVAVAYGERLPFRSNQFDILVCREVLEHVAVPKAVLRETFRVLRPHGYLILTVPYSITERLLNLVNPRWLSICGHKSVFSQRGLNAILEDTGFKPIRISKEGFDSTFFWFFHCIFRTRHDGTGRLLENQWLTEYIQTIWSRLVRIRGGWRITEFGNLVLPKSLFFYCKKV